MHIFGVVAFLQATGQTGSYSSQANYETNEITIGLLKSSRNERVFILFIHFFNLQSKPNCLLLGKKKGDCPAENMRILSCYR